jgi:DNA-binding transcriptional regulator YdaS (Cro superfamily)
LRRFHQIGNHAIHQKDAMQVVIATLGGTSAKAAKAIGVSPRTVEAWRSGRKRLTIEKAYALAWAMANSSMEAREKQS